MLCVYPVFTASESDVFSNIRVLQLQPVLIAGVFA